MSNSPKRELQLLLLAVLLALIILALLVLLLPPRGAVSGGRSALSESAAETGEAGETAPGTEPTTDEAQPSGKSEDARGSPPEEVIAQELLERPELIPFEGTLGGSMGFYTRENITVLNDRWVFARFEDGHVQGSMLLEYEMTPAGELQWEILAAELD